MDSHKIFEYFEGKVITKAGEFYKNVLVSGRNKERDFNFISNNFIRILVDKEESTIPKSNQELFELWSIFKNRGHYYSINDTVNIFKYELLENYNESQIRNVIPYKEVVIRIAIYEGLTKSYAIISNHNNYYSMLYKFNELENLVFTYDSNELNELENNLREKNYPKDTNLTLNSKSGKGRNMEELKSKKQNHIKIYHFTFNLNEFALYQKEWRNCFMSEVQIKDVFDKVMLDFNDPFNYLKKKSKYSSTTFYKSLLEDLPVNKKGFNVLNTYNRLLQLAEFIDNDVFHIHIENQIEKFNNKS